jgi:hypothetical protein
MTNNIIINKDHVENVLDSLREYLYDLVKSELFKINNFKNDKQELTDHDNEIANQIHTFQNKQFDINNIKLLVECNNDLID